MLRHTVHLKVRSGLSALVSALRPVVVQAHCDTDDGPAVTAGRRALDTGNLNHALPWIPAEGEAELREVFDRAVRVRALGPEAAELADRLFVETLVRIHRMGEGVGFTGIKPAGAGVEPVVAAADAALVSGDDAAVLALVPDERRAHLHELFRAALARRDHDVDDLAAARAWVAAYVAFVKTAEGHDHDHADHGHGDHGHGDHDHGAAGGCGHHAPPHEPALEHAH